jgi:hypothetical protein
LPMRLLLAMILMIGGLVGAVMSFTGTITVSSTMAVIDGTELSMAIALFSLVVFISGITNLLSSNN